MNPGSIGIVGLLFYAVLGVDGRSAAVQQHVGGLSPIIDELPTIDQPLSAADVILACQDGPPISDDWYVVGTECGRMYVVCRSGTVESVEPCPRGSAFHPDLGSCVDALQCADAAAASLDRQPRQIKFLLVDDGVGDAAGNFHQLDRRQIKFRRNLHPPYPDLSSGLEEVERRQIKFRSLEPGDYDESSVVPDERDRRQIKFRRLSDRDVEAKKHSERPRHGLVAFNQDNDQPVAADLDELPPATFWYGRR